MKQPKRKRRTLPSGLAGSYDDADGKDPRFDPTASEEAGLGRGGDRRKLFQLCSQVLRTLQMSWPADSDWSTSSERLTGNDSAPVDEVLGWTSPVEVVPAPNSHNLLVVIHCNQPADLVPDQAILNAIQRRADELRSEVARAISRKRTPRLSFAVMPRIEGTY